jgi:hypothetical protein
MSAVPKAAKPRRKSGHYAPARPDPPLVCPAPRAPRYPRLPRCRPSPQRHAADYSLARTQQHDTIRRRRWRSSTDPTRTAGKRAATLRESVICPESPSRKLRIKLGQAGPEFSLKSVNDTKWIAPFQSLSSQGPCCSHPLPPLSFFPSLFSP